MNLLYYNIIKNKILKIIIYVCFIRKNKIVFKNKIKIKFLLYIKEKHLQQYINTFFKNKYIYKL